MATGQPPTDVQPTAQPGAPNTQPTNATPDGVTPPAAGGTPQTFEAWIVAQGDDVKGLVDSHVKGLKSALTAEREQRQQLADALKKAGADAEEGSKLKESLTQLSTKLDAEAKRADFYEQAGAEGVTNLKLAWMAARDSDLFDRRGNPDWAALKAQFPELFRKPSVPGVNVGNGTQTPPAPASMNDFIRRTAGRL
jgi:hypothetical protein